jgi:dienelactone hydrolase
MANHPKSRRNFIKSAAALSSLPLLPPTISKTFEFTTMSKTIERTSLTTDNKSVIGGYGPWASGKLVDPPELSFRRQKFNDLDTWRNMAISKTQELVAAPSLDGYSPDVRVKAKYDYDGLSVEELEWQLPFGRATEAILLKPASASGPLPGVLGLHDHGGQKYFGKRKITRTTDQMHPVMLGHQQDYYSGKAWANELAKRGYVVLVHDTFTFGSRRVWYQDIDGITWGPCMVDDKNDKNPEDPENINIYNEWAGHHEHIMSKSLFCGGTTWPGVTLMEDQVALDILSSRTDVDENNLGCCGLSGGGLRTDYLGGLDQRVKCAISVGFMSTWRDFILHKSQTHTWMAYTPLLPKFLDFPEILGLRVPLPTMVMCDNEDQLYTLPEMKRADQMLAEIFEKAGAPDHYSGRFYPGDHKFDAEMQHDAFSWFDRWLT